MESRYNRYECSPNVHKVYGRAWKRLRDQNRATVSQTRGKETIPKSKYHKNKVVRPTRSKHLGFTFLKNSGEWKVKPTNEKKKALKAKLSEYLKRNKAVARPLAVTIKRVNEICEDGLTILESA